MSSAGQEIPVPDKQLPILTDFRWDDDVVFKNQARGTDDRGKKKEFVNVSLHAELIRGVRPLLMPTRIFFDRTFTNAS
jgi:hypothetical protein